MSTYLGFVFNAFQEKLVYRANICFAFLQKIIIIVVQFSIWSALYASKNQIATEVGDVGLNDMLQYAIIANCLAIFLQGNLIDLINDKIKSGDIAIDLIRPMSFHLYLAAYMVGGILYNLIFQFVPIAAFIMLFFKISLPAWQNLALFCFSTVSSCLVYFLICYIIGLLGFWFLEVWPFSKILEMILKILSGIWIPIWFFPKALIEVSNYLPFKSIYYTPLSIYSGKLSLESSLFGILQQSMWIVILWLVGRLVWKKSVKKLVIQGG